MSIRRKIRNYFEVPKILDTHARISLSRTYLVFCASAHSITLSCSLVTAAHLKNATAAFDSSSRDFAFASATAIIADASPCALSNCDCLSHSDLVISDCLYPSASNICARFSRSAFICLLIAF
jgi:hypothetical protein